MCVLETTVNEVAAVAPKRTPVTPARFEPVSVTVVPPATGPDTGTTEPSTGTDTAV